jgi:regulator of protease activity HflC (stomatin/prohibitin superfamily)
LQKEKQEAERKRVEAQGIADYQRIISTGLSDKQLQYEQIKAQKELAASTNTKIIFMNGSRNTPIILINSSFKNLNNSISNQQNNTKMELTKFLLGDNMISLKIFLSYT